MFVKPDQPILLVEDSPEDYAATVRSLRKAGLANPIFHCEDGDQALDFLYGRGAYASQPAPRPGLILLDLNLPGTDGRAVLSQIKSDENLSAIPVIVLTVSDQPQDVQACYRAGGNSYVKKPVDVAGFIQAIGRLANYWFEIVVLPKPSNSEASAGSAPAPRSSS
jgi:CheY-like chemotaxis protein